ncbi:MAG: pseudouridine synthase [Ignavibacteriaceae bacterium]|nr:pseudouridine synthase [Ignavibacteriaceae bacterium]
MKVNEINYFILNKPYGYLSQFTDKLGRKTLSDFKELPKCVYPVVRLDMDSEGLLLLSNDKLLVDFLLNPKNFHEKEYMVQVEGIPSEKKMDAFRSGLFIENQLTLPAKIEIIENFVIPERIPPIRKRMNIPVCWLKIIITEGRNRQVRKMTAAIGHPTLRLIRTRIKNISLGELKPGETRSLTEIELQDLKK